MTPKVAKSVRGTPPNTPGFSGAGSSVQQKNKQSFGSCGTAPDSSPTTSAAAPRTMKQTDLVVCAAEFVCSSWCGGVLRFLSMELRFTTGKLRRASSAAVASKFRRLSARGPAGAPIRDFTQWEKQLPTNSFYSDATHEPQSKREVRNQRGFNGGLVTLPPEGKVTRSEAEQPQKNFS